MSKKANIPVGTQALILSKLYYGVLVKNLERMDIDRYFSVLSFLEENNGCSQQYICNNLATDKTAMVKVINYLVKNGYLEQKVNPKDRREHIIVLTKKGEEGTKEVVHAFKSIDKKMFDSISKEDKDVFVKVLHKLSAKLEEMPSDDLFFNYKKTKPSATKKTRTLR